MATYVMRGGELVDRRVVDMLDAEDRDKRRAGYPTPRLSKLEPYESPIDGKEITSWAQRDKDLRDSNSYDPRDVKHERPRPEQLTLPFPSIWQ